MRFQKWLESYPGWTGLLVFWLLTNSYFVFHAYVENSVTKGQLLAACIGGGAFGLLHFIQQYFRFQGIPERYIQVLFHFSWISGLSGVAAFFSPSLGIQTALLGIIVVFVSAMVLPWFHLKKFPLRNGAFLVVVMVFTGDFWWQFFSGNSNAWKEIIFRYPLDSALFCIVASLLSYGSVTPKTGLDA